MSTPLRGVRALIHTPQEAASRFLEYQQTDRSHGIHWGIPALDARTVPFMPGDLVVVTGRPGHGKTSLGVFTARYNAVHFASVPERKRIVLYATAEQSVEEIEMGSFASAELPVSALALGKSSKPQLVKRAAERERLPLWILGESVGRAHIAPPLYYENIQEAVELIGRDFGLQVGLLVADYAQIFPHQTNHFSKALEVQATCQNFKRLGRRRGFPVLLLAQAGRQVDENDDYTPGLADGQHASGLEQDSDKHYGVGRPALTVKPGATLTVAGVPVDLFDKSLMLVKCNKQRFGPAGWTAVCHFQPDILQISDDEVYKERKRARGS